jgi:hypothetical protein
MNYVGIDHHRQYSHMTMMDQEGRVLRSGRVPNLRSEIEKFLADGEAMEAVIERGRSSYTMVDVLEEIGICFSARFPASGTPSVENRPDLPLQARNPSRKIVGRGIDNHKILKGTLRRRPLRDECQTQMVDDPVHNGILCEEGDDIFPR